MIKRVERQPGVRHSRVGLRDDSPRPGACQRLNPVWRQGAGERHQKPPRRGQALVVSITILFILLAIGLLFLRNALQHLNSTTLSNERLADLDYARSGIDFVNHELMTSPLGADWRPQPRNLNPGALPGLAADLPIAALDPDFQYLRPWAPADSPVVQVLTYKGQPVMRSLEGPSGGFTRIDFGRGRSLIRLTYNPRNALTFNGGNGAAPVNLPLALDLPRDRQPRFSGPYDPTSQQSWMVTLDLNNVINRGPWQEMGPTPLSLFMRIDAIGRYGDTAQIDNAQQSLAYQDTTMVVNAGIDRPYRVEMLAYKAFGLGDHLLFVKNNEQEGGLFDIGADLAGNTDAAHATLFAESPGVVAGDAGFADGNARQEVAGNIQVNGSAYFNDAWVVFNDALYTAAANPVQSFGVDVAGTIAEHLQQQMARLLIQIVGGANPRLLQSGTTEAFPSGANPNVFSLVMPFGMLTPDAVYGDFVRDSRWFDNPSASTARSVQRLQAPPLDLDRFRALTRDSAGSGLWINNAADMQPPIGTGSTHGSQQRDLAPQSWSTPYSPPALDKNSWAGGNPGYIYTPPGVKMVFHHPGQGVGDPDPFHGEYYYIRLFSQNATWPWADGTDSGSHFLDVYYTPDAIAAAQDSTNPMYGAVRSSQSNPRNLIDPNSTGGQTYPAPVAIIPDHTIMAEGNLMVHGDVAPGMTSGWWGHMSNTNPSVPDERESAQVLIVSRGTIYLDGSLRRAEDGTGTPDDIKNYTTPVNQPLGTLLVPSAIALLAQDHIAANVTETGTRVQHWDPNHGPTVQPDDDVPAIDTDQLVSVPPSLPPARHWTFDPNGARGSSGRFFRITFSLEGVPSGAPVRLYLRHASRTVNDPTPVLNTRVDAYQVGIDGVPVLITKDGAGSLPLEQRSITPLVQSPDGYGPWEYASYALLPNHLIYGGPNTIYVQVQGDTYYLSRVAVKPVGGPESQVALDGVFLANEGGFYVIPKDRFYYNPATPTPPRLSDGAIQYGPTDFKSSYAPSTAYQWPKDGTYPGTGNNSPALGQQVILDGSLTVNRMAAVQDQARWTLYDPAPVTAGGVMSPGPLYEFNDSAVDLAPRQGSWLPVMPGIPMVPGLVFEGEAPVF